ncbi:hypothetical protein JCM21900_001093 [Sporobolomyces salmonicolor]
MSAETPLFLPQPPPRFPTRFSESDNSPVLQTTAASWPDGEGKEGVDGGEIASVDVEWQLKTDSEEHIQRLEHKLREVIRRERLDSGYGTSSARSSHASEAYNGLLATLGENWEEGLTALDGEHDGLVGGDAAEEGTALLSRTEAQSKTDEDERLSGWEDAPSDPETQVDTAEEGEADLSDLDGPSYLSFGHPPPTAAQNAQRISFSNSVRISGGIRSSSRSCHQHRPLGEVFPGAAATERNHLLAGQPRVTASRSPRLVASVTSSSSPSRSVSPAGRGSSQPHLLAPRPRRPSSSASYRSSSHPYPASYSGSPGSHIPSRSSSPCSSIYAPLQPPSKHCPNPIWVRPAPAKLQRQAAATGLSFPEYLRNNYGAVDDDEEEDSDEDPPAPRYSELVQQQRRKKARWEERKRQRLLEVQKRKVGHGGFWDKLAGMLALGLVGVGAGRGGGAFGSADMVHTSPPPPPSPRRPSASISNSTRPNRYRGVRNGVGGSAASRPKSILSTSSSLSSASEGEPAPVPSPRRPHSPAPPAPPPPPPDKTEADVRFGPAPWRYVRLDWLVSKLRRVVDAVKRAFATASAGIVKQRERQEARTRQLGGYHAV